MILLSVVLALIYLPAYRTFATEVHFDARPSAHACDPTKGNFGLDLYWYEWGAFTRDGIAHLEVTKYALALAVRFYNSEYRSLKRV